RRDANRDARGRGQTRHGAAARPPGASPRSRRLRAPLPRERAKSVWLVFQVVVRSRAGRGADAGGLRARLAQALELPRRERLLLLALPADGERRALRTALAPPARRADRAARGPGEPGAGPAQPRAGDRLRSRESDGGAAPGRARRVRAPRRGGPDARGDRTPSGPGARNLEGAAAPRPPAAQCAR